MRRRGWGFVFIIERNRTACRQEKRAVQITLILILLLIPLGTAEAFKLPDTDNQYVIGRPLPMIRSHAQGRDRTAVILSINRCPSATTAMEQLLIATPVSCGRSRTEDSGITGTRPQGHIMYNTTLHLRASAGQLTTEVTVTGDALKEGTPEHC